MKKMSFTEIRLRGEEKIAFWWRQSSACQCSVFSLLGKTDFLPLTSVVSSLFSKINQTLNGNHNVPAELYCQTRTWELQHLCELILLHQGSGFTWLHSYLISFSFPVPCHNSTIFMLLFGVVQIFSKSDSYAWAKGYLHHTKLFSILNLVFQDGFLVGE